MELKAAKELLKKQQASDQTTQAPQKLTPQDLAYIREAVHAHTLKVDEEFRRSQPDEESLFAYDSSLGEHYETTGKALALGREPNSSSERVMVQDALEAVGVRVPAKAPPWASFNILVTSTPTGSPRDRSDPTSMHSSSSTSAPVTAQGAGGSARGAWLVAWGRACPTARASVRMALSHPPDAQKCTLGPD